MILQLTNEQTIAVSTLAQPGHQLLARVDRERFNGANPETSGTMHLVLVSVEDAKVRAVREVIMAAPPPAKTGRRRQGRTR